MTPEKIYLDTDNPGRWYLCRLGATGTKYIRSDIVEQMVKDERERIVELIEDSNIIATVDRESIIKAIRGA